MRCFQFVIGIILLVHFAKTGNGNRLSQTSSALSSPHVHKRNQTNKQTTAARTTDIEKEETDHKILVGPHVATASTPATGNRVGNFDNGVISNLERELDKKLVIGSAKEHSEKLGRKVDHLSEVLNNITAEILNDKTNSTKTRRKGFFGNYLFVSGVFIAIDILLVMMVIFAIAYCCKSLKSSKYSKYLKPEVRRFLGTGLSSRSSICYDKICDDTSEPQLVKTGPSFKIPELRQSRWTRYKDFLFPQKPTKPDDAVCRQFPRRLTLQSPIEDREPSLKQVVVSQDLVEGDSDYDGEELSDLKTKLTLTGQRRIDEMLHGDELRRAFFRDRGLEIFCGRPLSTIPADYDPGYRTEENADNLYEGRSFGTISPSLTSLNLSSVSLTSTKSGSKT